jgi:hypothetical protein
MSGVGFNLDQYAHAQPETHHEAASIIGDVLDGGSEADDAAAT